MAAILYVKENWVVDRLVNELLEQSPNDLINWNSAMAQVKKYEEFLELIDSTIWFPMPWVLNSLNYDAGAYRFLKHPDVIKILEHCRVVVTIHHIMPEKLLGSYEKLGQFKELDKFVDTYHVPSKKTKDYLKQLTKKEIQVFPFWTNPDLWKPLNNESEIKNMMKIKDDKFTIGSFQRDTENDGSNTPKLEKGPDILCDIIEKLHKEKKEIQLILSGSKRDYVINRLEKSCPDLEILYYEGVPIEYINVLYNCLDLYIVSSRVEGGPQAILEAGLAKCPIVSTDVGLASEILAPESIYTNSEDFHMAKPNIEVAYNNAMKLAPNTGIFEKFKKLLSGT